MQYTSTITGTEPITLADAVSYLRVDYSEDDSLIERLISSAREVAEEFCNRTFIDKTITFQTTDFSDGIKLPFPNHSEIVSVSLNGSAVGYIKTGLTHFEITLADFGNYATTDTEEVTVVYKAVADGSERVKQVVRMLVKELYDNRGDQKISENAYVFMLPLKVYQ